MNWKLADIVPELQFEAVPVDVTALPLEQPSYGASFLETNVGTAALVLAQHLRSPSDATAAKVKAAARLIRDAIQAAIDEELNDDGCEVLYGRAGLLYCILFLRTQLGRSSSSSSYHASLDELRSILSQLVSDDYIRPLVDDIVARGKLGARDYAHVLRSEKRQFVPSLMWRWHGKRYLGGAHGVGKAH